MSLTYTHAPRPVGGPVSFKLTGDRLIVDTGRKISDVPLAAVEQVRLTYEPRSFSQRAYQTRIRLRSGKGPGLPRTVTFSSLTWKSFIEAERLDKDYRAFLEALLLAIAAASPRAEFIAGRPRFLWIGSAALALGTLAAFAVLITRALQSGAHATALTGAALVGLGIWQLEPMIRLNRPRPFRADAPPRELLP